MFFFLDAMTSISASRSGDASDYVPVVLTEKKLTDSVVRAPLVRIIEGDFFKGYIYESTHALIKLPQF